MSLAPPRIPRTAHRFPLTLGTELPDRYLTMIDPATDLPIPFGSQPHTFELRVDLHTSLFVKSTGIIGSDSDPNVRLTFSLGEFDSISPGHYHAQLWAHRVADDKDWEPVNFRFVVNPGIVPVFFGLDGGTSFAPLDTFDGGVAAAPLHSFDAGAV